MIIFAYLNTFSDLVASPFSGLHPIVCLAILSMVTAIVLLLVLKKLSNQEKILFHKSKIFGHFLEIALFRDQFSRTILCQVQILKHNLLYFRYIITPMLVMALPMLFVCLQLEYRLGYKSFNPGQEFTIKVQLDQKQAKTDINLIRIDPSENISIETLPLRIDDAGQIFWRGKVTSTTGPHVIELASKASTTVIEKEIAVGNTSLKRFTPERRKVNALSDILTSGEDTLKPESIFKSVRVNYQPAEYPLYKWHNSPIIYYLILTLGFGLLIKPMVKVTI